MVRKISRFIKFLLLLAMVAVAAVIYFATRPLPLVHAPVDFEIVRGDSMKLISQRVADAGIVVWPPLLTWGARLSGHAIRIKAGSYRVEQPISLWDLIGLLSTGSNAYADLTLVEGWNFERMRSAMNAHPDLKHDTLGLDEREIMAKLGQSGQPAEGLFFPDTYSFGRGSSDLDLLRRAHSRMADELKQSWGRRAGSLPLRTPYEALVLASVVEKETGLAKDRPLIASVFVNRLKIGMPLQSDPTVIYGLGASFDGNLRKRDLQADTPFNSYLHKGLPPTPIAMPGRAALQAVLNPQASSYFYFVARGDGSSEFSRSLEEHNRAVAKYQRGGK